MNRIKNVLIEKGIKQTWLAEKLGKSYNMVNSYVQNRRQPNLEDLFKIASILHVNTKDLINDTSHRIGSIIDRQIAKKKFIKDNLRLCKKAFKCGTSHNDYNKSYSGKVLTELARIKLNYSDSTFSGDIYYGLWMQYRDLSKNNKN